MFSADLSWTEPSAEKVGERRERKARERSTPSDTPSIKSTISSRASIRSIAKEQVLWWTSSLKKAKSIKPIKAVHMDRPSTSRSTTTNHSIKTSGSSPRHVEIEVPPFRDPALQPAWTYSSSLSAKLPSGQPLDPPVYEVPELEGDVRRVNLSESRSPNERQWNVKTVKIPGRSKPVEETQDSHPFNPGSLAPCIIRRSPEVTEMAEINTYQTPDGKRRRRAYSVRIEGRQDFEGLSLQDSAEDEVPPVLLPRGHVPHCKGTGELSNAAWKPPTGWDIGLSAVKQQLQEQEKQVKPSRVLSGISIAQNTLMELTRFQRFIRRMENAGSKVILDRLNEEWHDAEAEKELQLEKRLWVLTAFQIQNLARFEVCPRPTCDTGKILELYGDLAEAYHLSAMNPKQKVQYLTLEPRRLMPLPGNVSYSTVPQPCAVPFHWADATFSHIRASTLPSLVPSSELPKLLRECYRLLAPGGMLELRIMDAAPVRKTAGPKMRGWIEDRVLINLERQFRCSKPCTLLPAWVRDAGFELTHAADAPMMRLPCASFQQSADVDEELKAQVAQIMWRSIWGDFVDDNDDDDDDDDDDCADEAQWWWEDEEVMHECLERETMFECGAIFAHKSR